MLERNRQSQHQIKLRLFQLQEHLLSIKNFRKQLDYLSHRSTLPVSTSTNDTDSDLIAAYNKRRLDPSEYFPPFFRDVEGNCPADNEHTTQLQSSPNHFSHFLKSDKRDNGWNEVELQDLSNAVHVELQRNDFDHWSRKLQALLKEPFSDSKYARMTHIKTQMAAIKRKSIDSFYADNVNADVLLTQNHWRRVARIFPFHSAMECCIRWCAHGSPLVDKNTTWTSQELETLKSEFDRLGHRHWNSIAKSIGNRRSPIDCVRLYMTRFESKFREKKFVAPRTGNFLSAWFDFLSQSIFILIRQEMDNRWGRKVETIVFDSWKWMARHRNAFRWSKWPALSHSIHKVTRPYASQWSMGSRRGQGGYFLLISQ